MRAGGSVFCRDIWITFIPLFYIFSSNFRDAFLCSFLAVRSLSVGGSRCLLGFLWSSSGALYVGSRMGGGGSTGSTPLQSVHAYEQARQ